MAGLTGFEPVITGSEPVALPLGNNPIAILLYYIAMEFAIF